MSCKKYWGQIARQGAAQGFVPAAGVAGASHCMRPRCGELVPHGAETCLAGHKQRSGPLAHPAELEALVCVVNELATQELIAGDDRLLQSARNLLGGEGRSLDPPARFIEGLLSIIDRLQRRGGGETARLGDTVWFKRGFEGSGVVIDINMDALATPLYVVANPQRDTSPWHLAAEYDTEYGAKVVHCTDYDIYDVEPLAEDPRVQAGQAFWESQPAIFPYNCPQCQGSVDISTVEMGQPYSCPECDFEGEVHLWAGASNRAQRALRISKQPRVAAAILRDLPETRAAGLTETARRMSLDISTRTEDVKELMKKVEVHRLDGFLRRALERREVPQTAAEAAPLIQALLKEITGQEYVVEEDPISWDDVAGWEGDHPEMRGWVEKGWVHIHRGDEAALIQGQGFQEYYWPDEDHKLFRDLGLPSSPAAGCGMPPEEWEEWIHRFWGMRSAQSLMGDRHVRNGLGNAEEALLQSFPGGARLLWREGEGYFKAERFDGEPEHRQALISKEVFEQAREEVRADTNEDYSLHCLDCGACLNRETERCPRCDRIEGKKEETLSRRPR